MSRNTTLIKNTVIILFGKICTQLISYLLLPVYTTVLSTEEYGTVDLLITYVTLIAPVVTIQMEAAVFRFLIDARNDPNAISRILTNSTVCIGGTIAVSLVGYALINTAVDFPYAMLFALCIIANALISITLQVARGLGDNVTYAIGSAMSGICTIVFNILFLVVVPLGVRGMLMATALAQLIGTAYIIIKLKLYRKINFGLIDKQSMKEMAKYSLPLIPNSLSWWIISVSDRTIVSAFLGIEYNGILAVATKFATIIVNVFSVFNLSWTEAVAVHIRDKDGAEYISAISNKCIKLFGSGGILLTAACAVFFRYLVGPEFAQAYDLIPLLIFGSVLNVVQTLYGIIYIGIKDTKKVSQSSLMAAGINLITDLFLIKFVGIYAAALSTIFAMLFLSVYRFYDVNKSIKIRISVKSMAVIFAGFCMCGVAYYSKRAAVNFIMFVAVSLFVLLWNKDLIIETIKMMKNRRQGKLNA